MTLQELIKLLFPLLLPIITVLLLVILMLILNDKEYIKYQAQKNVYCGSNQQMEFENTFTGSSNGKNTIVLFVAICLIAIVSLIFNYMFIKDKFIAYVTGIIAVVSFVCSIIIPTTQFSTPDYSLITKRITEMLQNEDFISLLPTSDSYFDSADNTLIDLKNSIIDKYTAYKEEHNKDNYYIRSDIEEEINTKFANKKLPGPFAKEVVKYMNFPYDAKLLNSLYETWQKSNSDCGKVINNVINKTATIQDKSLYDKCMLRVPTRVPYEKDTQKDAPLYLTWFLLIILFYYFIHPFYQSHKFYLVVTTIVIVLILVLYYIMRVRNNL